jgi:hypothetical protein
MSQSISKSHFPAEPKLRAQSYSIRGILIGIFAFILLVYMQIGSLVNINMYYNHFQQQPVNSFITHACQIAIFLILAWCGRASVGERAHTYIRLLIALFYLSYVMFPTTIHFPWLASSILWLQHLIDILLIWVILNYAQRWLPKAALFAFIPLIIFFVPEQSTLSAAVNDLLKTGAPALLVHMYLAGFLFIVLSWGLCLKDSPYEVDAPEKVTNPSAIFRKVFFWEAAAIILLAVLAVSLLSAQFTDATMLVIAPNVLSSSILCFGVIFMFVKKRLKISAAIVVLSTVLLLALAVFNFSDSTTMSMQLLALIGLGVPFLAYSYYYLATSKTWAWDFAVLFALVYLLSEMIKANALNIYMSLPVTFMSYGAAFICAVIALLMFRTKLDSTTLFPVQLRPALGRLLRGQAKLSVAFWGAGAYLMALAALVSVAGMHTAMMSGYNIAIVLFVQFLAAILWAICVIACGKKSSKFIRYFTTMFAILVTLMYLGAFWKCLERLLSM